MNSQKVLIIVPRWFIGRDVNFRYLFPLGLAYISAVLKKAGYRVDCLNINHFAGKVESVIHGHIARNGSYDFVCTGGISPYYHQIKAVIDAVRTADNKARIILGGGIVSSEPRLVFDSLRPDFGVIGEGEDTVLELISRLKENLQVDNVAGLIFRTAGGELIITPPRVPINDIDSIPYPDFEGFEFDKYLDHLHPSDQYFYDLEDHPRVYPLVCSRSCPFLCTFCFHPIGNKYRQRSIDSVMREMETMVKRYRINIIAVYDELFSNNRQWLLEFCKRFKKLSESIAWECKWGCQMRVDKIDDELLRTMKDSGCYMVSYGFESYSDAVLKSMKKHITPAQIDEAIKMTLRNHISLQANFIFGDTAETLQTAKETLDYWKKNTDAGIMLTFINPYPGTKLYERCVEGGIIKDKLNFIADQIFDVINMSESMNEVEFAKLWFDMYAARVKYRIYSPEYELEKEPGGAYSIKTKCPHCKELVEYKNYRIISAKLLFVMLYCRNCRRRFFVGSLLYRTGSKLLLAFASLSPKASYLLYKYGWPFLKKHDLRYSKNRIEKLLSGFLSFKSSKIG